MLKANPKGIVSQPLTHISSSVADEVDLPVTKEDLFEALSKVSSSVSAGDIVEYEKFMAEYGSS